MNAIPSPTSFLRWFLAACVVSITVHADERPAVNAPPMNLATALERAAINNPDARLAMHRIAVAQNLTLQAKAAFWPTFQIQSGYVQTDNPTAVFGSILNQQAYSPALDFNDVPDADNLNIKGLLTVPLYTGGKNTARREASKAYARASVHEAEGIRNQLGFEVVRAFYQIAKAREFLRAAEAEATALVRHLELAQSRYESGTALRTDALDLEVRLAQARENRIRADHGLQIARLVLGNLLGEERMEIEVSPTWNEIAMPSEVEDCRRPELQAAREAIHAAGANVSLAKGGYQPQVNAFGSVDYDRGWRLNGSGESYTAGIVLQWNLWDGGSTQGKVGEARSRLEMAEEILRRIRLTIDLEIQQGRLLVRESEQRLIVTEKTIEQAEESAGLIQNLYQEGLALVTQLIDTETALTNARMRRAEAEADRQIAMAELRKALGLPQLEPTKNNPFDETFIP